MPRKSVKPAASASPRKRPAKRGIIFESFSLHITEPKAKRLLQSGERKSAASSTAAAGLVAANAAVNPETAAKRILAAALANTEIAGFTAPQGVGEVTFKSLGTETVPLTSTNIVKFRQFIDSIPVFGTLISVEMDEKNALVSLNSSLARPVVPSHTARVSQHEALKVVAEAAGFTSSAAMAQETPELSFYCDSAGRWHLAYIFANVLKAAKLREDGTKKQVARVAKGHKPSRYQPRSDFFVDALSGKLIAEVPRTPALTAKTVLATDELGVARRIGITVDGARQILFDPTTNTETHDFEFQDPSKQAAKLPGKQITAPPPFSKAAVSAHANAADVARFLRDVLKRDLIDNKGGKLISVINAVVKAESDDGKQWFNAFWDSKEMVYGQALYDGQLRSLAASLDVVGHEFFHGVTEHTAQITYELESGALNESYSDIFGTIISNYAVADIAKWNWLMGDGLSSAMKAFRSMQDPTLYGQPKTMKDYRNSPNTESGDWGGVHTNSGIHNFAAYKVLTSKRGSAYLFTAAEVAAIFYIAVSQQLSRQSIFSDSRRGCLTAARSLFRGLAPTELNVRVKAIENAFAAAGINDKN